MRMNEGKKRQTHACMHAVHTYRRPEKKEQINKQTKKSVHFISSDVPSQQELFIYVHVQNDYEEKFDPLKLELNLFEMIAMNVHVFILAIS